MANWNTTTNASFRNLWIDFWRRSYSYDLCGTTSDDGRQWWWLAMMLSVVGEEGGEKEIGSLKGRKRSKEGRGFSGDKIGKKEKNRKKKKKINFWAVDLSLKRSNDVSSLSHLRNTVSPSHFRTRLECSRTSSVHSSSTHNNDLTHNVVVHSFSKASAWIVAACSYAISTTTLSSSSWALFTF